MYGTKKQSKKRQFLGMVTHSFHVGNQEFQSLGTGSNFQFQGWLSRSSNLWEPAVLCNGNLWFQGWELGVAISGNRQFLAMVTYGSKVGNQEFQSLGTGSSLQWKAMVPRLGIMSSNLWEPAVPCNGNVWEPGVPCNGNLWFPAGELAVSNLGTGALNKTKRSVLDQ